MKPFASVASVVLVGAFAPAKFLLPALAEVGALSEEDIAAATYETLIRDQIVHVSVPWGNFSVTPDRFSVEVAQAPYIRAADFALKCLNEIASGYTLVRQLGINLRSVYMYLDPIARDVLGRRLLPAAEWGSWGREVAKSQALPAVSPQHGGMTTAVLRMPKIAEQGVGGYVDARIDGAKPSDQGYGVIVLINDHYEISPAEASTHPAVELTDAVGTARLLDTLQAKFDDSIARSIQIVDGIISNE